jgi:hypothetical protein
VKYHEDVRQEIDSEVRGLANAWELKAIQQAKLNKKNKQGLEVNCK